MSGCWITRAQTKDTTDCQRYAFFVAKTAHPLSEPEGMTILIQTEPFAMKLSMAGQSCRLI